MSTYIIIGILTLIGLVFFSNWNTKQNIKKTEITQSRTENLTVNKQKTNRNLRLVVSYKLGQELKTISKKATPEIIKSTMETINWNEFHIVQLEDESNNAFKALHVGGSLVEDGLASGFVTDDDHILMVKKIETIEQMTEILLDFLKGEDYWSNKYKYE